MNNKEIANELTRNFCETSISVNDLTHNIESALNKAAGIPEHEFKFGDRVLVDNVTKALFISQSKFNCMVVVEGHISISMWDICIPDPAYAKTLTFVEHDQNAGAPVEADVSIFWIDVDGGLSKGANENVFINWNRVLSYAIIPEGFLK